MSKPANASQRWPSFVFNASIALNGMLLFLLFFESRLVLPAWMQVIGRMHPLLLHFPLVLVILYALLDVFMRDEHHRKLASMLLLAAAFTSVLSAIMGVFLSKEEGYGATALSWHKWSGVAISVFSLLWYWFQHKLQARRITTIFTSLIALFLIIVTGHLGASITHGDDFLLAPVNKGTAAQTVALQHAEVFKHLVKPVIEQKCFSCHNSKKAKGELVMETQALLLKGGKSGKLWDSTAADLGLLLQRIHLPLDQKKHMPPKNKPQLTEEEISILTHWIRKGADFSLKVSDLPVTDTLYQLAVQKFETPQYNFAAADAATVSKLNTVNRVLTPEATGSPALVVSFFNSQLFTSTQLNELLPVKNQVVSLNLAQMPLTAADINTISQFPNLRQLNLSFTGISGNDLAPIQKLKQLQGLALSGNNITAAQLQPLRVLANLKTVYAWNTPLGAEALAQLKQEFRNTKFETGYKNDTVVLKLSPPVSPEGDKIISDTPAKLHLKHYVRNALIRYTTDGSEPDSLHSKLYNGNETFSSSTIIKARAYKQGWLGSEVMEVKFFRNTYKPDSVSYLLPPNPKYADKKGKLLFDHEAGISGSPFSNWVGFRENSMECLLQFANPVTIQSIGLSSLVDVGSYIMPPASIEIWGGNDVQHLQLLGRLRPEQPDGQRPSFTTNFQCNFKPAAVKCIKVVANPVARLPAWHPGKGERGWVFVDELLVN